MKYYFLHVSSRRHFIFQLVQYDILFSLCRGRKKKSVSSYSGVNSEHRTLLNDCIVKWIDFVIAFDIELNSDTESIALTSIEKHLCLNFIRRSFAASSALLINLRK